MFFSFRKEKNEKKPQTVSFAPAGAGRPNRDCFPHGEFALQCGALHRDKLNFIAAL